MISIIARNLELSDFGMYGIITAFITILTVIPYAGLTRVSEREIARDQKRANTIIWSVLGIRMILGILIFILVILISRAFHALEPYRSAILFADIWLLFCPLTATFTETFVAFEKMQYEAIFNSIYKVLIIVFILVFFQADFGLAGVFLAKALAKTIQFILSLMFVSTKFVKMSFSFDPGQIKFLVIEGFPLEISELFRIFYYRIDELLIGLIKGKSQVGLFHGAFEITQGILLIPMQIMTSSFPSFSRIYQNSKELFTEYFSRGLRYMVYLGVPFAVSIIYYAPQIINLVLGSGYEGSILALRILGVTILLMFPEVYIRFLLASINRQVYDSYAIGFSFIAKLILDLMLIPAFGYIGACLGNIISQGVLIIIGYFLISTELGFHLRSSMYVKPIIASAAMIIFYQAMDQTYFLIPLCLSFIIYLAVLTILGAFSKREIESLKDIFSST